MLLWLWYRYKLVPIPLHLIMFMGALVLPHLPCSMNVLLPLSMVCSKDIMLLFSHMVRYSYSWRKPKLHAITLRLFLCDIFTPLQTGSGKTYTMGTGSKDGCQEGIVPLVMSSLFEKIETLKHQIEFQLHVSFIEVSW